MLSTDERADEPQFARIVSAADGRARARTARELHAQALAELQRSRDDVIPDDDGDDSSLRNNILR